MTLGDMVPWKRGALRRRERDHDRSFESFVSQMESLHREMDRLFEDMWRGRGRRGLPAEFRGRFEFLPQIDETEDDKAYYVNIELPGMDEKDVDVTVTDHTLTIRGEKKQEEEQKDRDYLRRERPYGAFRRVLELPGAVDRSKIEASFNKGVLRIEIPKTKDAQEKLKHITVKAA